LSVLLCPFSSGTLHAQGDLMVFPKRVIFQGATRSMDLNLANIGRDTARYSVSFLQYRMTDDGKFEEITKPDSGQAFADPYIRVFPRNVQLAPNESQIVKIQLSRTSLLQPGEYRSHIYFRSIPNQTALGETQAARRDTGLTIKLTPIYGITIPIIIRSGTPDTKLSISTATLEAKSDSTANFNVTLNRAGNMSVYGDITVNYISKDGKTTKVGYLQGVSVYTPNPVRRVPISLEKANGVNYRTGRLHLDFTEEVNYRQVKLAEFDYTIK